MSRPNIQMILGNHEKMCLSTLGPVNVYGARQLWRENGGAETRAELLYVCTPEERRRILQFISGLPDHLEIVVNERIFHLVHGYPADNQQDRIWSRPDQKAPAPYSNKTVIIGHTPTVYLNGDNGEHYTIWHGDGIIGIDCGCGNHTELRRLACLRLDDMKEFYV